MLSKLPEKRYYAIGEVAKAFGVKPSLLRFWEKNLNKFNKKNKVALKIYATGCTANPAYLLFIKEKGLTIEGAKKHLRIPEEEDKKTALLDKLHKVKEVGTP